jgi:hypothetical protein
MLPDLPAGIYKHYKGHFYQVLGYGHDANYDDRMTVIYIGLQLIDAHTGPRLSTRTALSEDPSVDAFFDFVHADGKKCCCAGLPCPGNQRRFKYIGPGWNP